MSSSAWACWRSCVGLCSKFFPFRVHEEEDDQRFASCFRIMPSRTDFTTFFSSDEKRETAPHYSRQPVTSPAAFFLKRKKSELTRRACANLLITSSDWR